MKGRKHSDKARNPELIDEENPEITPEELRRTRPAPDVLAELFGENVTQELLRRSRRGRPLKNEQERKVNQTLRIDPDVLEAYKQGGKGWQTRINQVLRDNMPKHQK
jgi:uncharacterized protein (DUF4415 family)